MPNTLPSFALSRQRPVVIAAIAVVVLFGLLFAWRAALMAQPAPAQPPPASVVATEVTPVDVPASLDAVGSMRAVREVMLSPEVAGRVIAIRFAGGDSVRAGAPLVQLYDAPERADRAAAVARVKLAAAQLSRSRELAAAGAESRQLLDQRIAEYGQAAAAVSQIDARLAQKTIRAPFSGVLGIRRVNPGQYLNPGDAIATLTALDALYVDFTLPQQDLSQLRVGGAVVLKSDAWPGRTFVARLNAIEPRISADTRNLTVQATVANPDGALRPGMHVTAALQLPAERAALVAPTTAIQTSASGDSVTVVRGAQARQGGKVETVPVTTGRRYGDMVVIASGVKPGDVVVVEGQLRLQPGAQVKVSRLIQTAGR